jgi:hypothetical protein
MNSLTSNPDFPRSGQEATKPAQSAALAKIPSGITSRAKRADPSPDHLAYAAKHLSACESGSSAKHVYMIRHYLHLHDLLAGLDGDF